MVILASCAFPRSQSLLSAHPANVSYRWVSRFVIIRGDRRNLISWWFVCCISQVPPVLFWNVWQHCSRLFVATWRGWWAKSRVRFLSFFVFFFLCVSSSSLSYIASPRKRLPFIIEEEFSCSVASRTPMENYSIKCISHFFNWNKKNNEKSLGALIVDVTRQ